MNDLSSLIRRAASFFASQRIVALFLILMFIGLGSSGCSSYSNYNGKAGAFYEPFRAGNVVGAANAVTKAAKSGDGGASALLLDLERGAILRAGGYTEDSLKAFSEAEEQVNSFDSRASVSVRDVGGGIGATLTNDNVMPYRGTAYDRIMLNTYKALGYLRLGETEGAMVELRRAYERQQQAVERFRKEIEKSQAESSDVSYESVRNNPAYNPTESSGAPDMSRYSSYADFVNPFTVWLDGIVFLHAGSGNSDLERARQDFQRMRGMVGDQPLLAADLDLVEQRFSGRETTPLVYVIFENGMAPTRREERIDLPIPIHGELIYVGAAYPRLTYQFAEERDLEISAGGRTLGRTSLICNMDAVVTREFNLRLPMVMMRIIAGATIRAATTAVLANQLDKQYGEGAALLGSIGMSALNWSVTRADLRTWQTLPKEFRVARLARPADTSTLRIAGLGSRDLMVELPPGQVSVVYIRNASPGLTTVHSFVLH